MKIANPPRGIILAASAITCSFCGAIYMWSIFTNPMIIEHGWDVKEISFAYSLFLLVSMFSGILAGKIQYKIDTRILMLIAGLMESIGWGATGFATSVPMLYLLFGFIGGFGDGIVYNLSVSVATQWYPEKPGFANGICTGCVALSALIFAPLGQFFINHFGASGSFKLCGLIFLLCFLVTFWFLQLPPAVVARSKQDKGKTDSQQPLNEEDPADPAPAASPKAADLPRDFSSGQMMRQPLFWVIWLGLLFASSSGLMITAHTSGIGQLLAGMTASQAALMVGIFAIGNFAGRFACGNLSDRIGCVNTVMLIMIGSAIELLFFYGSAATFASFAAQTCILGFFFGGIMSNLPLFTSTYFGFKHFGANFPLIYSGYTVSALFGPTIAAYVLSSTGSYDLAFIAAGLLSIAALLLFLLVRIAPERLRGRYAVRSTGR